MRPENAITDGLDAATGQRPLLDHPFYKAWAAGTLSEGDLRFYSAQYRHQVEAFPGYLQAIAERLPDGRARDIVLENLRDERDGDHPALWRDFAAAVGADDAELERSSVEPETSACVAAFERAAADAPLAFALGMLYGYESQTPGVAATKVEGLRTHYGIEGEGLVYFELHGELDVAHARELAEAVAMVAPTQRSRAVAEAGAAAGAEAIWGLLDGVVRSRGIC